MQKSVEEEMQRPPNPFPASAVARLRLGSELLTMPTPAIRAAREQTNDFLRRSSAEAAKISNHGMVIAVVGEYGTGKTHIASEILEIISRENNENYHLFYLDAPSDNFLALYRERFIPKIKKADLIQCVSECYSDVLVEELSQSELTRPLSDSLKQRKIDPSVLAQELGLMESEFIRRLRKKLQEITEKEDFASALLLLTRPEFQNAVWEWLAGNPPDILLKERGINRTINSGAAALEAIGVLAFLFGYLEHRFVLVIDEMEKVLSNRSSEQRNDATILALKKLMEVVSKTRSLLVLVGLPDFLEVLPEDAKQRISYIIKPTRLTGKETTTFIREAQFKAFGDARLEPFSEETSEYIATISGGNARKIIRLCFLVYTESITTSAPVTEAMIREVARAQFELTPTQDISTEISRLLNQRGWLFEQDKTLTPKTGSQKRRVKQTTAEVKCDFWLPIGEGDAGCCISLSRSIIQKADVEQLGNQISEIRKGVTLPDRFEFVLIINGYLAENQASEVQNLAGHVLQFRSAEFAERFLSLVEGLRRRLEESGREDVLGLIRGRVEEIARQNQAVSRHIEMTSRSVPSTHDIHTAVTSGLRAFFGQLSARETANTGITLPSIIDRHFKEAENFLNTVVSEFKSVISWSFGRGVKGEFDSSLSSHRFAYNLVRETSPKIISAVLIMPLVLNEFREKVAEIVVSSERSRNARIQDSIGDACRVFDSYAEEYAPALTALSDIVSRGSWAREDDILPLSELQIDEGRDVARKTSETLINLGRKVYQSVQKNFYRK